MNHLYINGIDDEPKTRIKLYGDKLRETISDGYWQPQILRPNQKTTTENINVVALGMAGQIIRERNRLEQAAIQIQRWHKDSTRQDSLWLYWRVDDEPRAKRALISDLQSKSITEHDQYLGDGFNKLLLTISRHSWEDVFPQRLRKTGVNLGGGVFRIANTGTREARIGSLNIISQSLPSVPNIALNQVWMGIREIRDGEEDFLPVWRVESGRLVSNDSSFLFDGSACENKKVRIIFNESTGMTRRFRIKVGEALGVGKNPLHQIGKYIILARVKASSQMRLQLRYGNSANQSKRAFRPLLVGHQGWHLTNLGVIQIPAGIRRNNTANDIRNSEIELWASGSQGEWIDIDRFILIPSRHFAKVETPTAISLKTSIELRTYEDMSVAHEVNISPSGEVYAGVPRTTSFVIPHDGGSLVIAGQRGDHHYCPDSASVELHYHPRWQSYMGIN